MDDKILKAIASLIDEANGSYRDIKSQVIKFFEDLKYERLIVDDVENRKFASFVENSIDDFEFLKNEKSFGKVLDSLLGEYVNKIQVAIQGGRYDEVFALKKEFMEKAMAFKKVDVGVKDDFRYLQRRVLLRFPSISEESLGFYFNDKQRRIEDSIIKKHDAIIDAIIGRVLDLGTQVKTEGSVIEEKEDRNDLEEKPTINIYVGPDKNLYTSFPVADGKFDESVVPLNADELVNLLENAGIRWVKFDDVGVIYDISREEIGVVLGELLGEECKVTVAQSQGGVCSCKVEYISKDALSSNYLV